MGTSARASSPTVGPARSISRCGGTGRRGRRGFTGDNIDAFGGALGLDARAAGGWAELQLKPSIAVVDSAAAPASTRSAAPRSRRCPAPNQTRLRQRHLRAHARDPNVIRVPLAGDVAGRRRRSAAIIISTGSSPTSSESCAFFMHRSGARCGARSRRWPAPDRSRERPDGHPSRQRRRGLAIVYAEPIDRACRAPAGAFTLTQKNKTFRPRVLAVPVGSTVEFPEQRRDLSQRLLACRGRSRSISACIARASRASRTFTAARRSIACSATSIRR